MLSIISEGGRHVDPSEEHYCTSEKGMYLVEIIVHNNCLCFLQKKAIQKVNKDIEKESEEGTCTYTCRNCFHFQASSCASRNNATQHLELTGYASIVYIPLEFMKTLLLMEATLQAENEVHRPSQSLVVISTYNHVLIGTIATKGTTPSSHQTGSGIN